MFENPRRDGQARNFTTNVSKILDLKSSSEQIFFRKLSLGAPVNFPVTSSINCFSFVLSCSAAVELPSDTDTSPTSTLLLEVAFKKFFLEKLNFQKEIRLLSTWYL